MLKGRLEKNLFNGILHADDPHLKLSFDGLADLRGKWPKVDFTANVEHFDPRAFGLIGGKGYSGLSMRMEAHGLLAPDSLKGSIDLWDVNYCQDSVDLTWAIFPSRADTRMANRCSHYEATWPMPWSRVRSSPRACLMRSAA